MFDLLHLDGEALGAMPFIERKERPRDLLSGAGSPLHFSDHQIGRGWTFYGAKKGATTSFTAPAYEKFESTPLQR